MHSNYGLFCSLISVFSVKTHAIINYFILESKINKLLNNTLIYTIGNFTSKFIMFLMIPLFSYYLTKDELGLYDIVMTSVNFFVPVVSLQIATSTYRYLKVEGASSKERSIDYISNGSLVLILGNAFFFLMAVIFNYFIREIDYLPMSILMILTISIYLFLRDVIRGVGVSKSYAISGIVNTVTLLVVNLFVFLVVDVVSLNLLFVSVVLGNLISIIYILITNKYLLKINIGSFDSSLIKEMLKFSVPLIPNVISWWLINLADKYIILHELGTESNGIYAISTRFPTILILINSIFIFAWQDHTIVDEEKVDQRDIEFNSKIFNNFVKFEFSIIFLLISFSELMVKYLVDKSYYEAHLYMPLLFIGAGFSSFSGYLGAIFLKNKKTGLLFRTSIVAGLINLITCLVFIKHIGLYASAIGTFVSFITMFLIRRYFLKNSFVLNVNYLNIIVFLSISVILTYLVYNPIIYINYFMIIFSSIFFILVNKQYISKYLKLKRSNE